MRIYLPTIDAHGESRAVQEFERLAHQSVGKRHELVSDPDKADVLLFTECHLLNDPITLARIRRTPEFKKYQHKSYVFDQRPRAYCSIPGLFTSVPWRALRPAYQVPWSYHKIENQPYSPDDVPDLLFSFVGSIRTHPCRPQILTLSHSRSLIRVVEGHVNWRAGDEGFEDRRTFFADTLRRSAFVLCPRGRATSSFRFYETMAAGRVPVVLGDDWVPPWGIDVTEFAIRWPERSIAGLTDYLIRNEERALEMGRRAREVYESRFAPEVMFDNIGDALEMLSATQPWSHFPRYGYPPDRRVFRHVAGRGRKIANEAQRRVQGILNS